MKKWQLIMGTMGLSSCGLLTGVVGLCQMGKYDFTHHIEFMAKWTFPYNNALKMNNDSNKQIKYSYYSGSSNNDLWYIDPGKSTWNWGWDKFDSTTGNYIIFEMPLSNCNDRSVYMAITVQGWEHSNLPQLGYFMIDEPNKINEFGIDLYPNRDVWCKTIPLGSDFSDVFNYHSSIWFSSSSQGYSEICWGQNKILVFSEKQLS